MESWYNELTHTGEEYLSLSNSGFTNDQLCVIEPGPLIRTRPLPNLEGFLLLH